MAVTLSQRHRNTDRFYRSKPFHQDVPSRNGYDARRAGSEPIETNADDPSKAYAALFVEQIRETQLTVKFF